MGLLDKIEEILAIKKGAYQIFFKNLETLNYKVLTTFVVWLEPAIMRLNIKEITTCT